MFSLRRLDGKIDVQMLPALSETAPAALSLARKEFLVVSEGELQLYAYPSGGLKATLGWPGPTDSGFDHVTYFDEGRALVSSLDFRLFVIDVDKMKVIDEVQNTGWPYRLAPGRFVTVRGPERNRLAVWALPR
jgi:hypothetical protein